MTDTAGTTLQDVFRDVMANVCTPVSVVTTVAAETPHGTTVSAFASLSMDPPMVVVALDRGSTLLSLIRSTRVFGLNVLAADQQDIASNFARKSDSGKFGSIEWSLQQNVPRLAEGAGFVACEVDDIVQGGDHYLLLGRVIDAVAVPASPMAFYARTFGTHIAG